MSFMIQIRHAIMEILRNICWKTGRFIPINKKKIIVSCYKGRGYCDNPKYIIEEILKKEKDVIVIWLVKDKSEAQSLPPSVKPCFYNHLEAIWHYITASVWIDNVRKDEKFIKKNGQLYIQTWHGGGGIKKVEKDVEEELSQNYITKAIKDSNAIDFLISEGRFYTQVYKRAFWYDGAIVESGLPRYDYIYRFSHSKEIHNKICNYYNIPNNKKVILYAPTFRKGYSFSPYNIDFEGVIRHCHERFGGEFVAYVHLHPNVANKFSEIKYNNKTILNTTFYPDMQELIAGADIMIGDFSSAIIDFSLTYKPAFQYANDADNYNSERGLYFDLYTGYPYPLAKSNQELMRAIDKFDEAKYIDMLKAFFEKIGLPQNQNASDIISNIVLDFIRGISKEDIITKYSTYIK